MANKCLLSLLLIISITNVFEINAEVTSCYRGTASTDGETVNAGIVNCEKPANFGCFRKLQGPFYSYGCIQKTDCLSLGNNEKYFCCTANNCNDPFNKVL